MIEENRRRVALQSELLQKGSNLDSVYRNKLQGMSMNRQGDIERQMENFYYQQQMVQYPEDDIIAKMMKEYEMVK